MSNSSCEVIIRPFSPNNSSCHVNMATFSKFEKSIMTFGDMSKVKNVNRLYSDIPLKGGQGGWNAYKISRLHTFQESDFKDNQGALTFTGNFSKAADYYSTFSLTFENCDLSYIDKIQFIETNSEDEVKVIDEITRQFIDIYNQMYHPIIQKNTLIIPSYHYRHNIFHLTFKQDRIYSIKITFTKPLTDNQKVYLNSKNGLFSGARRTLLLQEFKCNYSYYYDKIIQGIYTNDQSITKIWNENFPRVKEEDFEPLSTLSDVFISVRKLEGFPKDQTIDVIKSISLGVEMCAFYIKEPAICFKESHPILQNLSPASENKEYQSHYLISFAETTKPNQTINEWYFRGGINMNKLGNFWLDFEIEESIPKDTYRIELSLVCPTIF